MLTPKEQGALEIFGAIKNMADREIAGINEFRDKAFKEIYDRAEGGIEMLLHKLPTEKKQAVRESLSL